MFKVTVVGSNGQAGKSYTARDGAHADRIKTRVKAQAATGNSVTFKVEKA